MVHGLAPRLQVSLVEKYGKRFIEKESERHPHRGNRPARAGEKPKRGENHLLLSRASLDSPALDRSPLRELGESSVERDSVMI
jgi:hypothetical protein